MKCDGIFLLDQRICQECASNEVWDSNMNKCIPKPPECDPGYIRDPADQLCKPI